MQKFLMVLLWALASVAVIVLITLPINLETQLIAGMSVLAAMAILKLLRPDGIWRLVALAFGTAIVMRYVYWRTTSTLPPINQPENFIPGFLLYLAELYSVLMLALSLFVVAQPLPPRPSRAGSGNSLPIRRRLHSDLQRGRGTARQHHGGGKGHGLPRRQAERLAARRRRHRPEAQFGKDRRRRQLPSEDMPNSRSFALISASTI